MSQSPKHGLIQDPKTVLGRDETHGWVLGCPVTDQVYFVSWSLENASWKEFCPESIKGI